VARNELWAIDAEVSHKHWDDEDEWATFVNESEEAISREHTLWRASRGVDIPR